MSIIREFYANVLDIVDDKAIVRGVFVLFDAYDINAFYGIKDIGQEEHVAYLKNVDYVDIIHDLTIEGA